jgi:glyoxylase-like metal-dependent hydrolase (beta-lactamase superfamily II)
VRPPDYQSSEERLAWINEGAYQVADGVYRIPLPLPSDGLRAVNVYAIADGDGLVMIDSGWLLEETKTQLERSLRRIGAGLGDIRMFLITHMHRDHYTQAIALRKTFGSRVWLGAEERHSLRVLLSEDAGGMPAQADRLIAAGARPLIDQMAAAGFKRPQGDLGYAEPDSWINSGQDFHLGSRTLTAIATPGHTRGHVVFADHAAGLLFAGDHVLPHITPSISFEAAPPPLPLGDFLASLRLVRAMPDLRLLPAHGPVAASVHARVDELLDHHDARLGAIAEVMATGVSTAYQIAQEIRWTSRGRALAELDLINQTLAVCETQCHLDLLVIRGQATAELSGDVRHYRPPQPAASTAIPTVG